MLLFKLLQAKRRRYTVHVNTEDKQHLSWFDCVKPKQHDRRLACTPYLLSLSLESGGIQPHISLTLRNLTYSTALKCHWSYLFILLENSRNSSIASVLDLVLSVQNPDGLVIRYGIQWWKLTKYIYLIISKESLCGTSILFDFFPFLIVFLACFLLKKYMIILENEMLFTE